MGMLAFVCICILPYEGQLRVNRMLAHCPENPVLSHEELPEHRIRQMKIPLSTTCICTIVRNDGPYPVYHLFSQELRRDRVQSKPS